MSNFSDFTEELKISKKLICFNCKHCRKYKEEDGPCYFSMYGSTERHVDIWPEVNITCFCKLKNKNKKFNLSRVAFGSIMNIRDEGNHVFFSGQMDIIYCKDKIEKKYKGENKNADFCIKM